MFELPVKQIDWPKTFLATTGSDPETHVGKAFAGRVGGLVAWMDGRLCDWLAEYRMESSSS
jgi:hypothetical protein